MPDSPNKLAQFWQELKRRKVIRVVIVYAAAGFAIIEFVDIVTEPLKLPEWALTLVIILVAIGFPLAIIFSWIYEISVKGIKKTETVEPTEEVIELNSTRDKPVIPEKSIIVLPFENISPDPDQEYFSDGLTEEIITDLSHIHDLLVISRSSAMTFKGTKKKIHEIASDVNVRYVLEGSVRKAGNNLGITAQLIDANNDAHIWAEKYNGTLDNVFDIQEKVSRSIAESLKLKLSYEEGKSISERPIIDIQAYEYYLKAKKEIDSWTEPGLERALKYLRLGLENAGDNVLLYFGMGYVYWTYINIGFKNKEECIIQAEYYAKKIFDLDADSVHGHRLLGAINLRNSNLQQAVIQYNKILTIDPNDSETLIWLGLAYCNAGKQYAAVPLANRIIKIDPFNPIGHTLYSWIDILDGRFSLGLDKIEHSNKLVPGHPVLQVLHALYLACNNRKEESYPLLDQVMSNLYIYSILKAG